MKSVCSILFVVGFFFSYLPFLAGFMFFSFSFGFQFVVYKTTTQHLLVGGGGLVSGAVVLGGLGAVLVGLSVAQITPAIIILSYIIPGHIFALVVALLVGLVLLGLCIVFALQLVGHNCSVFNAHAGHILCRQAGHTDGANGSSCSRRRVAWTHKLGIVTLLGRLIVVVGRRIGTGGYDPGAGA